MTYPSKSIAPKRTYVYQCFALALVLRVGIVWVTARTHSAGWFFGQASELVEFAKSMLGGQGFSSPFGGSTGPSAFLAPGYPLLTAGIFRIFGVGSMASAVVIMLLQALFGAATVFSMMLLARRLFGHKVANLAGLCWAIAPPVLFLPVVFWETSFSIFMLTTIVLLALLCARHAGTAIWIGFGFACVIALSVNPSLATAIAGCFAWSIWQVGRGRRRMPFAVAFVCLLLVSAWPVRNWRTLHAFIPLRSNMGYELWQGNRAGSDGYFEEKLHPNTNVAEFQRFKSLGEVRYMKEKSSIVKAAISADPWRFIRLTIKRFFCFWSGVNKQSTWLMIAYIVATTILGFAGLFLMARSQTANAGLLAIPLILLPMPYYLTHPDFRFRCVIDPILMVLAAYVILHRSEFTRKNKMLR